VAKFRCGKIPNGKIPSGKIPTWENSYLGKFPKWENSVVGKFLVGKFPTPFADLKVTILAKIFNHSK